MHHFNRYNKVGAMHYAHENWEMYARKVPLLQVLKYMPASPELEAAISLADSAERGAQNLNIKDAIEINAGVALLPLPALKREIEAGTLAAVPLSDDRLVRPLGILRSAIASVSRLRPTRTRAPEGEASSVTMGRVAPLIFWMYF